tara:strand:+ start:2179 stop:2574 length:396 start_codon:yes stop_codon:yes gene_type:complete
MFVLGLCGYICYLAGYRRALADFPVEDVEHDVSLSARLDAMAEDVGSLIVDVQHATTIRQGLLNTGLTHSERLDELERVNTKQVFDERVEHSVPFGQWALKVSERSKTNQARVEELERVVNAIEISIVGAS